MENQLDALHPSVTHQSQPASRAGRVEKRLKAERGAAPLYYTISRRSLPASNSGTACRRSISRAEHGILKAYMGLRPQTGHTRVRRAAQTGIWRAEDGGIPLTQHPHVLVYPYLSVQSPLQQLRCLRPLSPDKTLLEIWHFRLKGAPEAIYRRSLCTTTWSTRLQR